MLYFVLKFVSEKINTSFKTIGLTALADLGFKPLIVRLVTTSGNPRKHSHHLRFSGVWLIVSVGYNFFLATVYDLKIGVDYS